ncbi:fimbria/pilus periplasmic chaperone [Pseudomonas sp. PDNC002]|uniref:fimbrial biogenesis chaperone n=1 Tax=Pseudomonas sp. PDNC002 TaxID=2811422 RepID=UPI00196654A1|nr:fimbria/pilus periplasmic chaperone [Pseudomonas sp. PDNC002]QRY79077.1 fimbria/pilus periplasmic chaperone [Pseudomonas sp. PDNC002]
MTAFSSKSIWVAGFLSIATVWSSLASAGIVISGSRVVYPAKDREVTVKMTNRSSQPALVQAWVDKGNADLTPDKADGPFLITPPITRVEANKGQALRLVYTGDAAASQKQETVFWLNVLDVPPMPKDKDSNFMQVAVRSRLKIFYRPEGLVGTPSDAAQGLKWSFVQSGSNYALRAKNDGVYHVSLSTVSVTTNGKIFKVKPEDMKMVAPGGSVDLPVQSLNAPPGPGTQVDFEWVNDWGSAQKLEAKL